MQLIETPKCAFDDNYDERDKSKKYKCLIFWKWERKCRASDIANKDNYEIYEAIDTWQYTSINRDAI